MCEIDNNPVSLFWLTMFFIALLRRFHQVNGRDLRQRDDIKQYGFVYTGKGYDIVGANYSAILPIPANNRGI
jgi:hypothetical protein